MEKPQTSANGELMACSSLFVLDPLNAHNSVTAGLGKVCVCVCVRACVTCCIYNANVLHLSGLVCFM